MVRNIFHFTSSPSSSRGRTSTLVCDGLSTAQVGLRIECHVSDIGYEFIHPLLVCRRRQDIQEPSYMISNMYSDVANQVVPLSLKYILIIIFLRAYAN